MEGSESSIQLVRSALAASPDHMTVHDRNKYLRIMYGDLDTQSDMEARMAQELYWREKHDALGDQMIPPPAAETGLFSVVGVFGRVAVGLEGVCKDAIQSIVYMEKCSVERAAAYAANTFVDNFGRAANVRDVLRLKDDLKNLCQTDPRLDEVLGTDERVREAMMAAMKSKGNVKASDAPSGPIYESRDDLSGVSFEVEISRQELKEETPPATAKGQTFRIWTCMVDMISKKTDWRKSAFSVETFKGNVPHVLVSETACVILHGHGKGLIQVDVHGMSGGRIRPARMKQIFLRIELGGTGISVNLADDWLSIGTGCRVYGLSLETDKPHRPVTHVTVMKISNTDISFAKRFKDVCVIGTANGVCMGIQHQTGESVFIEAMPARHEPIVDATYNNRRLFMRSVTLLAYLPFPTFVPDHICCFPSYNSRGMDVCGTLLFLLDHDGQVNVILTPNTHPYPFEAPAKYVSGRGCMYYAAVSAASPDELIVLYPDGRIRHLFIPTSTMKKLVH